MHRAALVLALAAWIAVAPASSQSHGQPAAASAGSVGPYDAWKADAEALLGADAARRDASIKKLLSAPDRVPPKLFAAVSKALFLAGRQDEARSWFFRGEVRFLIDAGLDGDANVFYVQSSETDDAKANTAFESFIAKGDGETNDRATDDAIAWDEATARNYELSGQAFGDPRLRPILAQYRDKLREALKHGREQRAQAQKAEDARATAAKGGVASAEADAGSNDRLDAGFAHAAKALRTIDLNGCVALPGQPMDDAGKTLFVRCPGFRKVELQTGRVLHTWNVSDVGPNSNCKLLTRWWPPSYGGIDPEPFVGWEYAASASEDTIVVACTIDGDIHLKGDPSTLQLPYMISVRGAPFAPLTVDAAGSGVDGSAKAVSKDLIMSADGRHLLFTPRTSATGFGLLVDLENRKARALRAADASMQGLAQPYWDFREAELLSEPAAVVAVTNRGLPGENAWNSAKTLLIWPLDGGAPYGVDLSRAATVFLGGLPERHLLDRGPVAVGGFYCKGNCGPTAPVPPNGAAGFRVADVGHDHPDLHWVDMRDMWVGTDAEAQAKYGAGSGPIHCEAQPTGRVMLWRRWAVQPFAARVFAHDGPVWCAMNSQAHTLVVGVGRYAHVYDVAQD